MKRFLPFFVCCALSGAARAQDTPGVAHSPSMAHLGQSRLQTVAPPGALTAAMPLTPVAEDGEVAPTRAARAIDLVQVTASARTRQTPGVAGLSAGLEIVNPTNESLLLRDLVPSIGATLRQDDGACFVLAAPELSLSPIVFSRLGTPRRAQPPSTPPAPVPALVPSFPCWTRH